MQTTQSYSKQYYNFMQFMQPLEPQLTYFVQRLQDEWKYEKTNVTDIILNKLSTLGPTKNYSKGQKIIVGVYLGNKRLGVVEVTKSKYKYYVQII